MRRAILCFCQLPLPERRQCRLNGLTELLSLPKAQCMPACWLIRPPATRGPRGHCDRGPVFSAGLVRQEDQLRGVRAVVLRFRR
jgi:hypothetical protein